MHVAIDVLPSKLNEKNQKTLARIVDLVIISFVFLALCIGGIRLVYLTFVLEQHSPALQIPLALVYLALPLSGTLIIYYKTSDLLKK
jgi:TRAP-type C4-dicarboxylate transport system permease small subunit